MTPGGIGADKNDEIGKIKVLVGAGHCIGAKGAAVTGHRGRHTQTRIGVDIGRSKEAFHQLIRDVVVLGQQLAGKIERDRVGTMLRNRTGKAISHAIECGVPCHARKNAIGLTQQGMK